VEWPWFLGAKQKRTGQQAGELVSGSSHHKFEEVSGVMQWLWLKSSADAGADYQAVTVFKSDLRNEKV